MAFTIEDFKDEDVILVYVTLFDGATREVPAQGDLFNDKKDPTVFVNLLKTVDVDFKDVASWRAENFQGHGILFARDDPDSPFLEKDW